MNDSVFSKFSFDIGWKTTENIVCFGKSFPVTINIRAYYEKDGITSEQKQAYQEYIDNKENKLEVAENLMRCYSDDPLSRFVPNTILFERDGSYALLCDDNNNPDDGIAVCLYPKEMVVSQDDYL